jgi:hypothetical protein
VIRLSSQQWAALQVIPEVMSTQIAANYKQTTLGSFARRGYMLRFGNTLRMTTDGKAAREQFGREDILRKVISGKLSVYFYEASHQERKTKRKQKKTG